MTRNKRVREQMLDRVYNHIIDDGEVNLDDIIEHLNSKLRNVPIKSAISNWIRKDERFTVDVRYVPASRKNELFVRAVK
jgi:hypothetical protein